MEPFKIKKKKKELLCHTWLKVKPEYHREMKGFMSHWLSLSFYAAEIKTDFNRLENKTIFKYVLTYCLNLCSQEVRSVGEISWKCLITSQSQILWPILPTEKPFCRLVYSKLWTFCSTFTSNINNLTSRLSGIIIVPWNCAYFWCCYHGGLEGRLEDKWIGSKSMCWKNLWRCWSMNCRTGIHQTQLHHPGNTGSRNSRTWIQRESPCRAWTDFCLCGVWFFFSEFFRNSWCNVPGSLDSQWAWP